MFPIKPKIFTLFLITGMLLLTACSDKTPQTVTLSGETMGTTYTVKYLSDRHNPAPAQQIKTQLDTILKEVNRQMSTYEAGSEISRFNRMQQTGRPVGISPDFAAVTAEAVRLNRLTEGALDVTVGPLVNLWGFGPDKQILRAPDSGQLARTAETVGIDKIRLLPAQGSRPASLAKTHPEVYLDLSSIAKGFGVDKLALHLESLGIRNYLVEIGGELRGKGRNAENQAWRIGIEQPGPVQSGAAQIIIPLDNSALATSGDYRNFHTDNQGKRLSHIINPQTRRPIDHKLASVSVIADNAMTADGLATGLFVLGEEKALEIARKEQLAVFLIIKTANGYRTEMSPAFKQRLH